jgi:hypothetical protein
MNSQRTFIFARNVDSFRLVVSHTGAWSGDEWGPRPFEPLDEWWILAPQFDR